LVLQLKVSLGRSFVLRGNGFMNAKFWENVVDGALVVLRKIYLNPRQSARAQRVQRMVPRELEKGAWRPLSSTTVTDKLIHVFDQQPRTASTKFYYSDVFAVGVNRIHLLGNINYQFVSNFDFHLLIAEWGFFIHIRNQQRILARRLDEAHQQLRMEKY